MRHDPRRLPRNRSRSANDDRTSLVATRYTNPNWSAPPPPNGEEPYSGEGNYTRRVHNLILWHAYTVTSFTSNAADAGQSQLTLFNPQNDDPNSPLQSPTLTLSVLLQYASGIFAV